MIGFDTLVPETPLHENTSLIRPFASIDKHYLTGNRDLDDGNDMDGNYLSLDYDQATFVSYYDNELPLLDPIKIPSPMCFLVVGKIQMRMRMILQTMEAILVFLLRILI